ncbi:hypothetical protein [Actinoplanes utahensis]|uniref:Uncharacterized protein n=1 Tax=Actinoplanes utahensis TaxID=1869 RepID=A0A0A6UHA3_ACTUT|nr:hypothetical protein [Actinoplanes utahensis]KHD74791.1 hypothetical protein MB27_26520 [Actinoplanes utahensis]GIF35177.1 hypothetical protein Aut01nite_81630 [Actinoplanes utahensis]
MQLREFVDAVTADEPPLSRTADDIIAAGRRAERRRRAGFTSAGAAGLVAVAVAGAFALPTFGSSGDAAPGTTVAAGATAAPTAAKWAEAAPFTWTFQGFEAGPFHVQDPIVASTAYQIASVYQDGRISNDKSVSGDEAARAMADKRKGKTKPTLYAYLTVYRPGAFDPAGIRAGKQVTVAGHRAVQANLPSGLDPKNPLEPGNKLFAWEYTAGAWAAVTSISNDDDAPSFADFAVLVTGLKPSKPAPATVPFEVGYVPAGYEPLQVGSHAMPGLDGISSARDGNYGGATYTRPTLPASGLTAPFDSGEDAITDGFHIYVTPSRNSNQSAQAGKSKCYDGGFCNVWSVDGKVQVQVSAQTTGNKLPMSELQKVAASIKVADVAKESTWTPAVDALRP